MKKQNRRVLLLLDNAPSHIFKKDEVQNVRISASILDLLLTDFLDGFCGPKEDVEPYASGVEGLTRNELKTHFEIKEARIKAHRFL